ncbi:MAG: MFS transporter [Pseudohongiellaceae bacterium]
MPKKLKRNITLVYGLAFFHSFMIIVPVIVPFFMSKGLGLAEIFYLQTVYAATIVLLEAPSGYIADVFGRRMALLVGSVFHGFGYLYLNIADDFTQLIIFEITVGIAGSLLSGADLALLFDTRKALDADQIAPHSKEIARLGFMRSFAEGLGALLGGVLAMWSFDLMILVQSVAAWMCLLMVLLVVEPPYKNTSGQIVDMRIVAIIRHLLGSDPVLKSVFFAIPVYSLVSFHAVWLIQPYWESRGVSLALFGVLWCSQSLVVAIANHFGYTIERKRGAVFALALIGALPIAGHFAMAWLGGWAGIIACWLLFFGRGLNQVILVNALNRRIPSEFRATANSLTSFTFRLGFITTGPLVGYIADSQGLTTALNLLGLVSIVVFALIMMPLIQTVRALQRQVTV